MRLPIELISHIPLHVIDDRAYLVLSEEAVAKTLCWIDYFV